MNTINMKKILFALTMLAAVPAAAQETYENANIATDDLNGTARYVAMGGAMEALGADISTISTNPAGIGLFRHSTINATAGFVSQQDASDFDWSKKTSMSFDQIGFVYSKQSGPQSFLNFGFNYHKSRNFNHILSAANSLNGASQNKLSYIKGAEELFYLDYDDKHGWIGDGNPYSQLDYLYYNVLLPDPDPKKDGFYYNDGKGYNMIRGQKGYIGEYDFNFSGNINNRWFLGLTVGIKDVNYKSYSEYRESLVDASNNSVGDVLVSDERYIDGAGFNVKFGAIYRPIEESPFRIGLYVHTPTFYDLTTENLTFITNKTNVGLYKNEPKSSSERYKFKLYTPWKFGISLGHTIGNMVALGATYEYSDYGSIDSRVNTGGGYDWYYDEYWEDSESDRVMNNHTESTLKGVSTFKVGAELKADEHFAVRLGYNYISPMYNLDGFKNGALDSPGSYYASATDYTNWKATNRLTAGIGVNFDKLSLDLAYQYAITKGEFSPFMGYEAAAGSDLTDNFATITNVDNKRHQLLLTLGYHF